MKKINIVKKSEDYNRIIKNKKGVSTIYFIINKEENNDNIPKFGITFVKKFGNAVTRNKIKRRIKSIIDNNKSIYENDNNYIIIAKKTVIDLKYQELERELIKNFEKIREKNYEEKSN